LIKNITYPTPVIAVSHVHQREVGGQNLVLVGHLHLNQLVLWLYVVLGAEEAFQQLHPQSGGALQVNGGWHLARTALMQHGRMVFQG